MSQQSCYLSSFWCSEHWTQKYSMCAVCPQVTTAGLGATFPATQASGWCSGCKIASKTTKWPSWIKSRLCSKGTGGHVTLKVCKETETSQANSVICTRGKFTLRTRRKKSGTTLYTYEHRMPLWKSSDCKGLSMLTDTIHMIFSCYCNRSCWRQW